MTMDDKKPRLPIHEWLAVCMVCFAMLFIIFVSQITWKSDSPKIIESSIAIKEELVEVFVEGAVLSPHSHIVKKGARLRDVLALVSLSPDAQIDKLKLHAKVRDGQTVKVPRIPMITIFVEGAIEEVGPLRIPKGSSLSDLIEILKFKEGADLRPLQKKRKLREGETVKIAMQPSS